MHIWSRTLTGSGHFYNSISLFLISSILEMSWLQKATADDINRICKRVEDRGFDAAPLPEPFASNGTRPCLISTYRTDSRGSVQVCFNENGRKHHVMVHILSYVKHNPNTSILQGMEVSHLCHVHRCCEPSHLVLESSRSNHSRKNCVGMVWSDRYHDWIPVCDHNPPCLTSKIRREQ